MAQAAYTKPSERVVALSAVILLHFVAGLLFLYHRWPIQPPRASAGTLTVVALSAQPAVPQTAPPPPLLPSDIEEAVEAHAEAQPSTEAQAAVGAPGVGCATLELVRNAILNDPAAVDSVLNSPPQTRSIAEAIVLWSTGWSESAVLASSPLGATRAAVERGLATVDDGCLDEPIAGPRLIPIPAGTGTMFVVFGSGNWTWRAVAGDRKWGFQPTDADPSSK